MKTRKELVEVYERVKTGTREKIIYIASDNSQHESEIKCNQYESKLKAEKEFNEACDRMHLRTFDNECFDSTGIVLKTTTIEDLHIFENRYSGYCDLSNPKYFEPNKWLISTLYGGGDYKDDFYYVSYDDWINDVNDVKKYIEDRQ